MKGQRNDKSRKGEKLKIFIQKPEGSKHRRRWEDTFKKDDGST
jgi:hypothetical protein